MTEITILLAEDDPLQRQQTGRILGELGHRVVQASNGREAVQIIKKQHVDMVLTDLKMPEMDGIELVEHVKKEHDHIPVGVLTSYPVAMSNLQADALLYKPFGGDQLKELVQRLMEERDI